MSKKIAPAVTEPEVNEMDEMDEMEAELGQATKEPKAKAEKTTKEPKIGPNQIGVKELAEMLETTGRELRIYLRKNFRDMNTEKGHTYAWEKGSAELQEIINGYKAAKTPKVEKKADKKTGKVDEAKAPVEAVPAEEVEDLDDIDEL